MALVEVEYVGPFDAVTVPAVGADVARGGVLKVSPDVAAGLLEQPDNWRQVAAKAAKDEKAAD